MGGNTCPSKSRLFNKVACVQSLALKKSGASFILSLIKERSEATNVNLAFTYETYVVETFN